MTLIPKALKQWLGRRPKLRRSVFLLGPCGSVAFASLWVANFSLSIIYWFGNGVGVGAKDGALVLVTLEKAFQTNMPGWAIVTHRPIRMRWWFFIENAVGVGWYAIPLWMIILPCACAAIVAWPSKPNLLNHCRRCDYNLTGNESGVCPECGEQI